MTSATTVLLLNRKTTRTATSKTCLRARDKKTTGALWPPFVHLRGKNLKLRYFPAGTA